jgi:hypothetical protein
MKIDVQTCCKGFSSSTSNFKSIRRLLDNQMNSKLYLEEFYKFKCDSCKIICVIRLFNDKFLRLSLSIINELSRALFIK